MTPSKFTDKAVMPDDKMVQEMIAGTYALWKEFYDNIQKTYPDVNASWKHYGKTAGWSFQVKSKKRTLFYFVPVENSFDLTFILGDKAVAEAERSQLPKTVVEELLSSKHYAEGRFVTVNVTERKDIDTATLLTAIKNRN
jgi:hypothetical protein